MHKIHLENVKVNFFTNFCLLFQKSGPLRHALDADFLCNLAKDSVDITDSRVAQGMASMLGRNVLIITSSDQDGAVSQLYRPFIHQKLICPSLALGHIKDHHFVPLQKSGNIFVSLTSGIKRS